MVTPPRPPAGARGFAARPRVNVLIVKLSSLGDVVHAMPAVQDIRRAHPQARIDWVVERGFAPLVARCAGVRRVIPCDLRRWRKAPLAGATRAEWRAFCADLRTETYDAVIDLQGLTKSALVARMARLAPGGRRFAMANRTDGSSYEAPTRWVADVAMPVAADSHAVQRSRVLCAARLGYACRRRRAYGLRRGAGAPAAHRVLRPRHLARRQVLAGTHWVELGSADRRGWHARAAARQRRRAGAQRALAPCSGRAPKCGRGSRSTR
jgi:heptosyltransferase-1